jgi:hypothetical protein
LREKGQYLPDLVEEKRWEGEVELAIARDEEVGKESSSEKLKVDDMGMFRIELIGNGAVEFRDF